LSPIYKVFATFREFPPAPLLCDRHPRRHERADQNAPKHDYFFPMFSYHLKLAVDPSVPNRGTKDKKPQEMPGDGPIPNLALTVLPVTSG
jgi:hypothetical protein